MSKHIPAYALNNLSEEKHNSPDVLLLLEPINEVREPLIVPHRINYYGIGICTGGKAKLTADLETYEIIPGCLIAMSPHTIKQWHYRSDDFQSLAILFTLCCYFGEPLLAHSNWYSAPSGSRSC